MKSALKSSLWLVPLLTLSLLGCGPRPQDNDHLGQSGPAPNAPAANQPVPGAQNGNQPNDANAQKQYVEDLSKIPTDPKALKVLNHVCNDIHQGIDYIIRFQNGDNWHIASLEIFPDTLHRQDGRNQLVGAKVECISDNDEHIKLSSKEFNLVLGGGEGSDYILGGLVLERDGKVELFGFADRERAFSQEGMAPPTKRPYDLDPLNPTAVQRHEPSPQAPKQALPDDAVPPPAPAPKPAN